MHSINKIGKSFTIFKAKIVVRPDARKSIKALIVSKNSCFEKLLFIRENKKKNNFNLSSLSAPICG